MRKLLLFFVAILAASGMIRAASANLLTNGSLTGPIANSHVPSGWTITASTPDTMDGTHNAGLFIPFVVVPSGPSPDGGTWVGFARGAGSFESFAQTVSGLTIGATYDLSWYAGNFGAAVPCPFYCGSNAIEALINGTPIGDGGVLPTGPDWTAQSLLFVASATSVTVEFRLRDDVAAYMSIDGISLTARNDVPEPLTLTLFGLSLVGVALVRCSRPRP